MLFKNRNLGHVVCIVVLGIAGSVSARVSKNELRYVADGCPPMKSKGVALSQIAGVRDTFLNRTRIRGI